MAVVQLAPPAPSHGDAPEPDAGVSIIDEAGAELSSAVQEIILLEENASLDDDAAIVDAGDGGDAEVDPPGRAAGAEHVRREERAKEALERAQRALAAGDRTAAAKAIDEAERYDPEHPDIEELHRKL